MKIAAVAALILGTSVWGQLPTLTTSLIGNNATNGLSAPLYACAPPGDLTRLFVLEKGGRIKVRTPATQNTTWGTFLDISTLVSTGSEQGLLGMAFHPNYAANGWFFVNYTNTSGHTVIARYSVSSSNPNVASATQSPVTTINQPFSNHNGGTIQFGPDGYLYIGMGDGGSGNDPLGHGQNTSTLLGKMLRINVDTLPYTNPSTNPYVGTAGADEIWAIGLRNPFRFSFDRLTGDMYIGDVGQSALEELDFQPATDTTGAFGGRNYGWRCKEGTNCTGLSGCSCTAGTLTEPFHTLPTATYNAIIGGVVYRGCAIPQLRGYYIFGNYNTGNIWRLQYNGTTVSNYAPIGFTVSAVAGFGEDGNGEVYACSRSGNAVYKIIPSVPQLVGVTSYGTGTPGCNGSSVLSLACSPTIMNPGETINSTNGPALTNAIGIIGNASLPPASDPLGIAVETLVDLTPLTYFLYEAPVAANGVSTFPIPIPPDQGLVGVTFYAQQFYVWSACSPSPLNLSSSQALSITIQP